MSDHPDEATAMLPADTLKPRLQAALGADFVVEQQVGEGGFAHVFAVTDRKLSRRIAVKVLRPEFTGSRQSVQRFIREAESAAKLNHPNILQIFFVGEGEGLVFFGMPMVDGETLDALLRRQGQLPEEEVARIGFEVADALSDAHGHQLVHRDIKPQNIMLQGPKRRVLVADFGIAKAAAGSGEKLTGTGMIIGSPHYMSPEQAGGEATVDHRSDLYSLGVVLWEMLAGEVPFDGPSTQGILIQHITKPMPAVRTKRQNVSASLAKIVARCTEKKPEDRYQTAAELAQALRETGGTDAQTRRRAAGFSPGPAVIGAVVLLLFVMGGFALWMGGALGGGNAAAHGVHGAPRSADAMVAVLPFEALTSSDAVQFSRTAAQLLTDALVNTNHVPAADGHELMGHWTSEQWRVDAPLERKAGFAFEHRANQMVIGNAVEAGNQLRLSVDVYDTHDTSRVTQIARAEETGPKDSLFAMMERLAATVAGKLCSEPGYNPDNRCFDVPPAAVDTVTVSFTPRRGRSPTPPSYFVRVTKGGRVSDTRVRTPSSADTVTALGLAAVREARYRGAKRGEADVEAWTTVQVEVRRAQ
ncbi:MAG: serine/threonine-protein kinase [Gemmatimonadales bacterium]|nr:serine/threonine-protein kinase [Gemmatimonadales bacterium]